MTKKIVIDPTINYDGILTPDERKRIMNRIESAFSWVGATIPEEIELQGEKFNLNREIQDLIMKDSLTDDENHRINKLISALEKEGEFLKNIVKAGSISDIKALELSHKICGILRAVHELHEQMKRAHTQKGAVEVKRELMDEVEDTKRWLKFVKKIE